MRKFAFLFFSVLFVVTASAHPLQPLRLVTGVGYEPFTDSHLEKGGVFTMLVEEALKKASFQLDIKFLTFPRGYMETKRGDWIATFPWMKTPERQKDFLFSDPVMEFEGRIYVLESRLGQYKTVRSFYGKSICSPDGYTLLEPMRSLSQSGKIKVERALNNESCFRMLAAGRVDAVEANAIVGATIIERMYPEGSPFHAVSHIGSSHPLYVIFPKSTLKRSQKFKKVFNRGLSSLVSSGERKRLIENYMRAHRTRVKKASY